MYSFILKAFLILKKLDLNFKNKIMRVRILLFAFFSFSFAFSQSRDNYNSTIFYLKEREALPKPSNVKFENLLRDPKKYKYKTITVFGYLSLSKNESTHEFYLNENAFLKKDKEKAILYLQFKEDSNQIFKIFNNGYVYVTGKFVKIDDNEFKSAVIDISKVSKQQTSE